MQLDFNKPPKSFWLDTTSQPNYPTLNEDLKVDVAIIGGGFVGISTAYLLSQLGVKTAVFEANRILQGTTGHTTAKVTSQHGLIYSKISSQMNVELAKQYADANEAASKMIERIASENGIACDYTRESAYVYTLQDENVERIAEEVKTANSLGIKANYIEKIPLDFPIKAAVRFDDQAKFHPRKFLLPLAEIVTRNNCRIYEQSKIVKLEESNEITLITDQGKRIKAERVVIASHYPCLNKPGFYFARIYTDRSYVIAIKAKEKYPGGMYITAEDPSRSLRSQRSDTGELIFVGGEHHKTGQGKDTKLYYEALIEFAKEKFTVEDIPYRWSAQDCMTLDNIPYVGQFTKKSPKIYVATGFGKWGMTNSMASAMLLSDLIIKGNSPFQEVYSPARKTTLASIGTLVSQNANVAKELIESKGSIPTNNIEIKPGEGKVILSDGQKTGAFRDDQGILHIVDTTCTHMGCELQWNSAERSWDCPCHGSRFNYEGDIIEGPAVKPLKFNKYTNSD
jgi:glycine/D-amino acid oxidase-like deaminating enzyme/nitrite reductase/ring-hydroxylating ferredoxin subunit